MIKCCLYYVIKYYQSYSDNCILYILIIIAIIILMFRVLSYSKNNFKLLINDLYICCDLFGEQNHGANVYFI